MRYPKIVIRLIATIFILGGVIVTPASAETSNANAAQGIEVSPALVELNASKGKTYDITLHIRNVTASDLVYNSSVDDFNSAGETGSPHIITDSTLPPTASIKTWITTIPQFQIPARQLKVVNVQVVVPNNAESGGHYGVLRFSGAAPELESTGVGLSASAGVLMLIRVDGTVSEKASLASFYTAQNGKQSSFFEDSPITFITRIKNDGNIHIKPVGSIEIRDMFGGLVKTLSVNKDKSNVLPDGIRRFETEYNKTWMFGRYTANLTLGYGTTGQAITNTISFWVIPYKIILVGLLFVITVIFIIRRIFKIYIGRVIEKAKNEGSTNNGKHSKKKD